MAFVASVMTTDYCVRWCGGAVLQTRRDETTGAGCGADMVERSRLAL